MGSPAPSEDRLPSAPVDVAIVGAGVVGCAVAQALARTDASVVLLEAGSDVGTGTSKANTAILHTGFDASPGTSESRLVRRGYELLRAYAAEVGIPVEPTGALVVAWDGEQAAALPSLAEKATRNGYRRTSLVDADELRRAEPNLGPGAMGALAVPDEAIICPFTTPLALATDAVLHGVRLLRRTAVTGLRRADGHGEALVEVSTTRGVMRARWVVNAAGLRADEVDGLLGVERFTVTPRRGELIVFDKLARSLLSHILLAVPGRLGKGVLVSPTVLGNVVLGPTAVDIADKEATGSTAEGIAHLRTAGRRILPALLDEEVTAVYVGLRAATGAPDYALGFDGDARLLTLGGVRSTGLTASMAIGEEVVAQLRDAGIATGESRRERLPVRMASIGEAQPRPYLDGGAIACHCERVTVAEVDAAMTGAVPAVDLDGVRRRTRATLGRCQGFYCSAPVASLIGERGGRSPGDVLGLGAR